LVALFLLFSEHFHQDVSLLFWLSTSVQVWVSVPLLQYDNIWKIVYVLVAFTLFICLIKRYLMIQLVLRVSGILELAAKEQAVEFLKKSDVHGCKLFVFWV